MSKARKTDLGDGFFEGLKEILSRTGEEGADASEIVKGIRSIAEEAVEETRRTVSELLEREKIHKNRVQVLGRWRAKSQEWGLDGLTKAIAGQIASLARHRKDEERAKGTLRTRKNEPYDKAFEQITSLLEHQGVEYGCYLASCVLWYSGFSEVTKVDAIQIVDALPLEFYRVRGEPLKVKNLALRRRLQRFEAYHLKFLKEKHQEFSKKGHPHADLADLFRLQIIEAERRLDTPRKKRPQNEREARIRRALQRQEARNRGEQVPVDEEESLRRKILHQLRAELKAIGQNSS